MGRWRTGIAGNASPSTGPLPTAFWRARDDAPRVVAVAPYWVRGRHLDRISASPDSFRPASFDRNRVGGIGIPGRDVGVEKRDHLGFDGIRGRADGLSDVLLEFVASQRLLEPIRQHLGDDRRGETDRPAD